MFVGFQPPYMCTNMCTYQNHAHIGSYCHYSIELEHLHLISQIMKHNIVIDILTALHTEQTSNIYTYLCILSIYHTINIVTHTVNYIIYLYTYKTNCISIELYAQTT